jgi:N-methylhydantoinase A
MKHELYVGIDVGGTFTDIAIAIPTQNKLLLHKVPSTPDAPDRAIVDGIAAILQAHGLEAGAIARLYHGTTTGTNALIQRRCGKVAVVTTRGFRDLVEIGRQIRPKVYDIHTDYPPPLVPRSLRFEVSERVRADGVIHAPLALDELRNISDRLRAEQVDCVVICFINSYAYPDHERQAADYLTQQLPDSVRVVASADVFAEFREYERFSTAVINGALLTVINEYLDRFVDELGGRGVTAELKVSQSAGGLMSLEMARRLPILTALSGPAAGVIGAANRAVAAGFSNVITLDVGGTSSDVSLLREGAPAEVQDRTLAGFPLRVPALDVNVVGAGGGSVAWIDVDGLLKVGPHSAGAEPGPACYDLGGEAATVTDANVVLGRLNGEALLDGRMPIDKSLAEESIAKLASNLGLSPYETAAGIIRVACANIVKTIRTISVERGHNPSEFSLFAFGGAGPLHARDVAHDLGIERIIVPPDPGILCADGLLHSDIRADFVTTVLHELDPSIAKILQEAKDQLETSVRDWFAREDVPEDRRRAVWTGALRYKGQNHELNVPIDVQTYDEAAMETVGEAFRREHERAYGYAPANEPIEFVNLRVRGVGILDKPKLPVLKAGPAGSPVGTRGVIFDKEDRHDTPIYRRAALAPEQRIDGPAIIEQLDTTIPIFPQDHCVLDAWGNLIVAVNDGG